MKKLFVTLLLVNSFFLWCGTYAQNIPGRWTPEAASSWYNQFPWLAGCDYIPATAINQIEMWSEDSFDPKTIDRELTWAEELGFNTMRVFLSSVVYSHDPSGMKKRIDKFLGICHNHGITPLFVFLDDCWNPESTYGKQPSPKPGIHNSGWVQDPSVSLRADTVQLYASLEKYVTDIISTFGHDPRVLLWDLYNEPGNGSHFGKSLPLLRKMFLWARKCHPIQPLTAGIWNLDDAYMQLNIFQLENSDIISYHNYNSVDDHEREIKYLRLLGRPLVCTEYMARKFHSTFHDVMPLLKKYKVAAINWGLVSGKTNTIFSWGDPRPDGKEPTLWFHDILRQDGTPFRKDEVDTIKALTDKQN